MTFAKRPLFLTVVNFPSCEHICQLISSQQCNLRTLNKHQSVPLNKSFQIVYWLLIVDKITIFKLKKTFGWSSPPTTNWPQVGIKKF